MTTIYLIRHAEAEGNLYRRIHGWYDALTTTRGWLQIQALERRFTDIPIDAVWSSPLFRTMATARAIYRPRGLELHTHPGLRERMQKWIDTGVLVVENESGLLFTYGHLLGLRAASICVALGSMFADPNANVYGAYADPEHLARRIETATRIAMRAAELLEGSK